MKPILLMSKRQLDANDVRQCLRIAFGGTLGFVLCKLMGWNYGAFFVVQPILLLPAHTVPESLDVRRLALRGCKVKRVPKRFPALGRSSIVPLSEKSKRLRKRMRRRQKVYTRILVWAN